MRVDFRDSYSCVGFYFCFCFGFCSFYAYPFCCFSQHELYPLYQSVFLELLHLASFEAALVYLDQVRTISLWVLAQASSLLLCIPDIVSRWFHLPWPRLFFVQVLLLLQWFLAFFLLGLCLHWANLCSLSPAFQTSGRISYHWTRAWERVSSHYSFQVRLRIQRSSTLHYCRSTRNHCTLGEFDVLCREKAQPRVSFLLLTQAHVSSLPYIARVWSSGCANQLPVWSPSCNCSLLWLRPHFRCWLRPSFRCFEMVSSCDARFYQSWLLCELVVFPLLLVLQTVLLAF